MSSSSSQTGASFRRLGSSAAHRLTGSLLGSSGKVASVGLVTACLTLAFTLWFRVALEYQTEVAAPAARQALELNASINESLAALRGWVAFGDPESISRRRSAWTEGIEPSAEALQRLSGKVNEPGMRTAVQDLERALRDLRRIQWAIEDVAQTPGNHPAELEYEMHLAPLRRSILAGLEDVIDHYANATIDAGTGAMDLVVAAARFRSAFARNDLALHDLLNEYSAARAHAVEARLGEASALATRLSTATAAVPPSDTQRLIEFLLGEFQAYRVEVPSILTLQSTAARNVSKMLFEEEAQPLANGVRALSEKLADAQTQASARSGQRLASASYVVIALALLMGLLSAGSLFVSYRLRRQVEDVMNKAKALGQYVIDAKIGTGGMGEVFLAHHAMLRRPTAIKLLRAESSGDLRAQSRFQQEVRLTSQLTHPNTIEIFDYGRTPEGIFYYAMEFLEGFTLDALVQQFGPVDPRRVVHILLQACGSLGEAHRRGLLHRDVKPSNMMLTERGGVFDTLKLLDFGLAREVTEGAQSSDAIAGTPMYIAPEVILSADAGSPSTDLYALGAVGYYLLAGTTIFAGGTTVEIFERHLTEEVEFPSRRLGRELPEDLETVILSCLAKDPADRPASADALAEMLRVISLAPWSLEDARLWWHEYAEALQAASGNTPESTERTGLSIAVETTRS